MSDTLSAVFEQFYADLRKRGQLPTWFRRRDALAQFLSGYGGGRATTSSRNLRRAEFVVANGCPELIRAMDGKTISIGAAAELAHLPYDEQRECLENSILRRYVVRALRTGEMVRQ